MIYKYNQSLFYLSTNNIKFPRVTLAQIDAACSFTSFAPAGGTSLPFPPAVVIAQDGQTTEVLQVAWSAGTGATSYKVYLSASNSNYRYLGSTAQLYTNITDLEQGITYYVSVTAVNAAGESSIYSYDTGHLAIAGPVDPGEDAVFNLSLGEPINGQIHSGIGNLRGWAISNNGIDRVEIFIDGKYMYDAPYGGLRVDVEAAFPNLDGSLLSGYSLAFGYADLGAGQHTVRAVAHDLLGNSTEQSSTFNVVVYDQNFINSNEVVDLSSSTISVSGDEIMINGASIGQ